jgi:hypothetical protein
MRRARLRRRTSRSLRNCTHAAGRCRIGRAGSAEVEAREKAIETGKVRNPLMFQRLEERIIKLEGELEALRAAMLDPANYASASKMKELQATEVRLKPAIAEAYEQWENWQ